MALGTDIAPRSGLATRTLAGSALRMPTVHALSSAAQLCQHSWAITTHLSRKPTEAGED